MTKNRSVPEDIYEKPRKFRDRSKKRRGDIPEKDHPLHKPYAREHKNWTHAITTDGLGEDFVNDEAE